MKVLVTGATGVLGRRSLPQLVKAGHAVSALARTKEKADLVRAVGATPVGVNLFDRAQLVRAVDGQECVINLATTIPPPSRAMPASAWAENNRIRSEASRRLVEASLTAGVVRFLQESIAFMYADAGEAWIDEDAPLEPPPVGMACLVAEAQAERFNEGGGVGVVLRFGQLYDWYSAHTRFMRAMVRRRLPALPGPASAYSPTIAADDAAAGIVAAREAPSGASNVSDDEPMTRRASNLEVAEALGAKPPITTGSALLRLNQNTRFYLRSQRVSNRRLKEATT